MTKIELISLLVGKELNDVALIVDIFDEMSREDQKVIWQYIERKIKQGE